MLAITDSTNDINIINECLNNSTFKFTIFLFIFTYDCMPLFAIKKIAINNIIFCKIIVDNTKIIPVFIPELANIAATVYPNENPLYKQAK